MSDESVVITQRELLLEMREDIRVLRAQMEAVAREQALGVERRSQMRLKVEQYDLTLEQHTKAIADLQKWRDEASGAMKLGRWAFGSSLVASVLVVLQIVVLVGEKGI